VPLRFYLAGAGSAFFAGAAGDDFVEDRFLIFGTEDAAQALDLLAGGGAAAHDDGDVSIGNVHALVQDPAGDQLRVGAAAEAFQRLSPLVRLLLPSVTYRTPALQRRQSLALSRRGAYTMLITGRFLK